jgi:hypothetical protein
VFDGDRVRCRPVLEGDDMVVEVITDEPEQPRASFRPVRHAPAPEELRAGETLPDKRIRLEGEWGSDYGIRAGDAHALCNAAGVVHPAVWPALANHLVHTEVARGSWIHTRSIVRHHALAPAGVEAVVRGAVVRRFISHGERAVLDVHITVGDVVVASLEHEAIVALP